MHRKRIIKIKGIEIPSKFFFAPINTGLASNGNPTLDLISFHSKRSNSYTGINYVGNVAVSIENCPNDKTLYINEKMTNYGRLAEAISKKGSIAGAQIGCLSSSFKPQTNWKNSHAMNYIDFAKNEVADFTLKDIKRIIKSFQTGIIKLIDAGFQAIQIHGAHGYFLNNFLSSSFNVRKDEFGADKTLIVKEILDGISSYNNKVIIDLRISVFEQAFKDELSDHEKEYLNRIYSINGIDIISVSNGIYNLNKQLIYPLKDKGNAFMLPVLNSYIKEHPLKDWNISGNVRDLLPLSMQQNDVSYSLGRSLIADHDYILKHFEGKSQDIIKCIYSNDCHYYSLKKTHIKCGVNNYLF